MSSRSRDEVVNGLVRAWRAARLQTDLLDDAAFEKLGINRTDGRCLDVLEEGPMTSTALAAACGISPNALTTVVDRLAARGLVERIRDHDDRRRVLVALTPLAQEISARLYGPVLEWSLAMFAEYTTAELELLTTFLDRGRKFQAQHIEYIRKLELP